MVNNAAQPSRHILESLVAKAKRAASRRGQKLSTGHLVLAMVQSDSETAGMLAQRGIRESDLLARLGTQMDSNQTEPASAIDVALERAQKLAQSMGELSVRAMHVLMIISREPRYVAARLLNELGAARIDPLVDRTAVSLLKRHLEQTKSKRHPRALPAVVSETLPMVPSGTGGASAPSPFAQNPQMLASSYASQLATLRGLQAQRQIESRLAVKAPKTRAGQTKAPSKTGAPAPSAFDQHLASTPSEVGARPNLPANELTHPRPSSTPSHLAAREFHPKQFPILSAVGRNLTAVALRGQLDPVIGRDREIEQLIEVLLRRRGHHPILVGPSGVGKTSVVEGLAQRLLERGDLPAWLGKATIVEMTAGALVSGTGMRGALSERLRALATEVGKADHKVLLFFDDIHTLVGGPEGPDDLAVEFRALLSRGMLFCIGATNDGEYRKRFERDPALTRRFTRVDIEEPGETVTEAIVQGLISRYEKHHNVRYQASAVASAVALSSRFLTERRHPDKALLVVDLAGARAARRRQRQVKADDVAEVVSGLSSVPVERLTMSDAQQIRSLESQLKARVIGQGHVMGKLALALRKAAAGFRGSRPWGTFLLLGPTGVGKTETAKVIHELLFPGAALCRIDMSEYSEAHAVARLLGAPPGYVGHEEGGQLTEAVRRRPFQLVLLDEVDKAHRDVLLSLLPMLDEGRLTDSKGRVVDFRNTVVVMTSNLGVRAELFKGGLGFSAREHGAVDGADVEREILAMARKSLPPELWNRMDEVLSFRPLGVEDVKHIAQGMLTQLSANLLQSKRVLLSFGDALLDFLIDQGGFDPELGARPMRRTIARLVEGAIADALLSGQLVDGMQALVDVVDGQVAISTNKPKKKAKRPVLQLRQ